MEIREINHEIETLKNIKDLTIYLFGDIHYDDRYDKNKLKRLKEYLNEKEKDYIFIVGDLINNNNIQDIETLLMFIEDISSNCKTIITFGNREFIQIINRKRYQTEPALLMGGLKKIDNVTVLRNSCKKEDNLNLFGIENSSYYYETMDEKIYVDDLKQKLPKKFDEKSFNIVLSHTPLGEYAIEKKDRITALNDCDLFVSAHNHNCLTFPFLENVLEKNRGIMLKHKLYPNYARGSYQKDDMNVVINGGITKFSNKLKLMNEFYYMDIDKIRIRSKSN